MKSISSENPFCTRRIRPGAAAYCFPPGTTVEDLLERLRENNWRGEIVGPHGSGKSTLLARILPAVEQAGRRPVLFELHDGQRRLSGDWRRKIETPSLSPPAVVVVDGYEQLSPWSRFCLKRYCGRRQFGLLVTTHLPTGLPIIFQTSTSPETARQVVEQLMQKEKTTIADDVLAELFARHGGNIRELLFDLYDLFEQRRKGEGGRMNSQ